MNKAHNVVLVCITEATVDQCLVLIHTLGKNYSGEILLAHCGDLDPRVLALSEKLPNKTSTIKFLQQANEDGMVVKTIMTTYKSNLNKLLYIKSSCIVRKNIDHMFTLSSRGYALLVGDDYSYKGHHRWMRAYASEDIRFNLKKERYHLRFFDAGVVMFCMDGVRESGLHVESMFERFIKKAYSIKLGVGEFLNDEFKYSPIKLLPQKYNHFGDKYLCNSKNYHKSIRTNYKISQGSAIANFEECLPWSSPCEFNRENLQFPLWIYSEEVEELKAILSPKFVSAVQANGLKWRSRLGNLPLKISEYFGVKNGTPT